MFSRNFKFGKVFPRNESFGWFLFSVRCFPAFAWVDRSGRGFNPRPAKSGGNPRPVKIGLGLAQGRKAPPLLNIVPQFQNWKASPK